MLVVAWVLVAGVALVLVTQVVGDAQRHPLPVLHALLPWLGAIPLVVGAVALTTGHLGLGSASLVLVAGVVALGRRLPGHQHPAPPSTGTTVRVLYANVLATNDQPGNAAAAVLAPQADVIALSEVTEGFVASLEQAGLTATHPFIAGRPGRGAEATVVWSRWPLAGARDVPLGTTRNVVVAVRPPPQSTGVATFHLFALHTLPPARRATRHHWASTLDQVEATLGSVPMPVVVVGDFNASRWHPHYRRLLRRTGLLDVHERLGHRWQRTWPAGGPVPRFVHLDHALHGSGVQPRSVQEVHVPGSDHTGLLVELLVELTGQLAGAPDASDDQAC